MNPSYVLKINISTSLYQNRIKFNGRMNMQSTRFSTFQHEIEKELHVEAGLQRLFFRGKQLENGYMMYDYNINLNDVIQLMVKINLDDTADTATSSNNDNIKKEISESNLDEELVEAESPYYKIGDAVDSLDQIHGAWFEAIVLKIFKKKEKLLYNLQWEFDDKESPFNVPEALVRPRAGRLLSFDQLSVDQKVMINYNVDEPQEIGFWYDFTISKVNKKRKLEELIGILHMGRYIFCIMLCVI